MADKPKSWRERQDAQRKVADDLAAAAKKLREGYETLRHGMPERKCSCGEVVAVGYKICPNGHPYYGD